MDWTDIYCHKCLFFNKKIGTDKQGECRVNPPKLNKSGFGIFPVVFSDEWCGKFTPTNKFQEVFGDREQQ